MHIDARSSGQMEIEQKIFRIADEEAFAEVRSVFTRQKFDRKTGKRWRGRARARSSFSSFAVD